jgi:hypothetical protein
MKATVAELADLLRGVADGTPPPTDSELTVVQPPDDRSVGVLAFPGQNIIVADVSVEWVRSWLASDDLSEPFSPAFLGLLSAVTGRAVGNIDTVLVARAHGRRRGLELAEITDSDHPRVARARQHRAEVRAWACPGGLLVLGRGVAGRWEAAVEVDSAVRGFGLGRGLFGAALGLLPEGESVWAQVAPGNAASLRALLAAGYRPVGGEVLFEPRAELPEGEPIEWFGSYLPAEEWQDEEEPAEADPAQAQVTELELAEPERASAHVATHAAAEPPPPGPAHAEPPKPQPAHAKPGAEPAPAEPTQADPGRAALAHAEPADEPERAEPTHDEPERAELSHAVTEPAAPAAETERAGYSPSHSGAEPAGSEAAGSEAAESAEAEPSEAVRAESAAEPESAALAPTEAPEPEPEPEPESSAEPAPRAAPTAQSGWGAARQAAFDAFAPHRRTESVEPAPEATTPAPPAARWVRAEDVPFEPVYVRLPPIDTPAMSPRPVEGDRRPIETHASPAELAAAEADAEAELDADEDTELAERDEPLS